MKAVVPAGSAGVVDVTVTSPDGSATSPISPADEYTYDTAATVPGSTVLFGSRLKMSEIDEVQAGVVVERQETLPVRHRNTGGIHVSFGHLGDVGRR